MVNTQVFVDLLLKLAVGMNLVRHDNFLGEVSSQMAFGFLFTTEDRLLSRARYCACAGFFVATRGVIRNPPFGVEFRVFDLRFLN